ncbi:hypothetical protein ACJJIK_13865 [Microbulbifer sp. ZKSA006]|uniref:hypothetical protein n=1 Tax=Microbulbifer sp. ZKSA006 TaxID=3243390 RepID=UPI00403A3776
MISLKDLSEKGMLGEVYITMHSDRVKELIGEPDYTAGGSRKHKWENIWQYGDLELGFDQVTRELCHIAIDFWGEDRMPEQGEALGFDPWIFKSSLPLNDFLAECRTENIEIIELEEPSSENSREFVTEGGMHLIFGETDLGQQEALIKLVVSEYEYT